MEGQLYFLFSPLRKSNATFRRRTLTLLSATYQGIRDSAISRDGTIIAACVTSWNYFSVSQLGVRGLCLRGFEC
jgi:hypothetical protein